MASRIMVSNSICVKSMMCSTQLIKTDLDSSVRLYIYIYIFDYVLETICVMYYYLFIYTNIEISELLMFVRGEMNPRREALVRMAFRILDKDDSGVSECICLYV